MTSRTAETAEPTRLAVVIHAFYPEIFREILLGTAGLDVDHTHFITTSPCRADAVRECLEEFGLEHELVICENRGRDVAPFLTALRRIAADDFGFVLKLHTKRSPHRLDGDQWRREMYECLASPAQIRWILGALRQAPSIGMVGPIDHVVPMTTCWELNEDRVRSLASRMGIAAIDVNRDKFIAGTMFMARVEALRPILGLGLEAADFEPESGQTDGTLAHALERGFSYGARAAGLELAAARVLVGASAGEPRLEIIDDEFRCTGRLHAPARRRGDWFRALWRAPRALSRFLGPPADTV